MVTSDYPARGFVGPGFCTAIKDTGCRRINDWLWAQHAGDEAQRDSVSRG